MLDPFLAAHILFFFFQIYSLPPEIILTSCDVRMRLYGAVEWLAETPNPELLEVAWKIFESCPTKADIVTQPEVVLTLAVVHIGNKNLDTMFSNSLANPAIELVSQGETLVQR